MNRLKATQQLFSSRERKRIRERARLLALDEVDNETWEKWPDAEHARAYAMEQVEWRLRQSREFGNPLISWFVFWCLGKAIDWAIQRIIDRRNAERNGHA